MAGNPEYTNIQIVVTADGYFFTRIFTAVPAAMSEKRSDYHPGGCANRVQADAGESRFVLMGVPVAGSVMITIAGNPGQIPGCCSMKSTSQLGRPING